MEVHTYLSSLPPETMLNLSSIPSNSTLPIEELMETHFPHIFKVFPQNPTSFFPFVVYPLFLLAVKKVVEMDCEGAPECVRALGLVVQRLESDGFDCRFIRSELMVKRLLVRQRLEIVAARRELIAKTVSNLEKEMADGEDYLNDVLTTHRGSLKEVEADARRLLYLSDHYSHIID